MNVLITGVAGFIGFSLAIRLLDRGDVVVGVDNLNDYYDASLKAARLNRLRLYERFAFDKIDIVQRVGIESLFLRQKIDVVIHLAAQAGVRYSITNPYAYVDANLVGFINILEAVRKSGVGHLIFASSSSVYGANTRLPFSERDNIDHPVSLYAATKKANELMAHTYAHLYGVPCTGLRFFTVYGPWGRPDMAYFKFARAILEGKPIHVFNSGNMTRDLTYIDDIVDGVMCVIGRRAEPDPSWDGTNPNPASSKAPYRIYNIGNNQPVMLMRYIEVLEQSLGKKARMEMLPMQAGDVQDTAADVSLLETEFGYRPKITIEEGIPLFVKWYRDFYNV